MKPHPRSSSVVNSVASAAESVRYQRTDCLRTLDQKGATVSAWIQQLVRLYETQMREMGRTTVEEEVANNDSLPDDVVAWIDSLKKKGLQNELRGRELNTTGLKDELRQRLIDSMVEERQKANAVRRREENRDEEATKDICESMDSASLSEKVPDKKEVLTEAKDVEMQDVSHGDENKRQNDNCASAPMEVDVVVSDTGAVQSSVSTKTSSSTKTEPMDTSKSEEETKESSQRCTVQPVHTDPQSDLSKAQSTSPTRTASRSPLRRMQAGVGSAFKNRMQSTMQSALKNLRPVSPKKPTASSTPRSPPKPKNQVVVMPEAINNKDEAESSKSTSSEGEGIASTKSIPKGTKVHASGPSQRTFTTTPGLASSGTFSASSKLGSLNINSDSVKAKNDARMARIAEIRNKSKPVTASSSKLHSTYAGLKSSASNIKKPLVAKSNKKQVLTSQMREKAFGRLGEAAATINAAPSQSVSKQPRPLEKVAQPSLTNLVQPKSRTPPPSEERSPVLSPLDTYEMSDHGGSSDTDEEEERARRVGKKLPKWANKENLRQALQQQFTTHTVDPDELFGEVTTCNLEAIFGRRKSKYHKRTSSGNWARDKVSAAEKLAFKRQVGLAAHA